MSALEYPSSPAPAGYHWDWDLYSDKEQWTLVENHVEDPEEVKRRNLLKFNSLTGYYLWNRSGPWNITNLAGLNTWGNIPQETSTKPRALAFYSNHHSSSLTMSILTNPGILEEAEIYHLKDSSNTMMISTSEQLRDFVRDFQKPTMVTTYKDDCDIKGIPLALCIIETYQEVTYTESFDLHKVTNIQWKKVQYSGFYGWFIDNSLHEEAMQYHWYRQIGSPMGFVWDIRAFSNPTEDLKRISFD